MIEFADFLAVIGALGTGISAVVLYLVRESTNRVNKLEQRLDDCHQWVRELEKLINSGKN